jgi:hypothetical protein
MKSFTLQECHGTQARPRTNPVKLGDGIFEEYQMMKYYSSLPVQRYERYVQEIATFKEALRCNTKSTIFCDRIIAKTLSTNLDSCIDNDIERFIVGEILAYCTRLNSPAPLNWQQFLNEFNFLDTDYDDERDHSSFSYILRSNHEHGIGYLDRLDFAFFDDIGESSEEQTQDDDVIETKMADEGVGVTSFLDDELERQKLDLVAPIVDGAVERSSSLESEYSSFSSDDENEELEKIPKESEIQRVVSDILAEVRNSMLGEPDKNALEILEYSSRMLNVFVATWYMFQAKAPLTLRVQNVFNAVENFVWYNTGESLVVLFKRLIAIFSVHRKVTSIWHTISGRSLDTMNDVLGVMETCDAMKCVKDILHFSLISRFFTDNRIINMIFGKVSSKEYAELTLVTVLKSTIDLIKMLRLSTTELITTGTLDPKLLYSEGRAAEFLKEVPKLLSSDITVENIEEISHKVLQYKQLYDKVHFDVVATNNNALIGRVSTLYSSLLAKEKELLEILNGQTIDYAPYVYIVNSTSSVGKTLCVDYLSDVIKVALGVDVTKPSTYIVQNIPGKPWMLNFHEFTGSECRFDDFGQFRENMENMVMFLQMTGNLVTVAPQPEADKMGKHKVKPKLISVTSNVADPGLGKKFCFADEYWKCMPAFIRRFQHTVVLTLKPEFTAANGELDKDKCNALPAGQMADAWFVTIYAPKLHALKDFQKTFQQDVTFEVVKKDVSIFEAAKFLRDQAVNHRDQQRKMLARLKESKQTQFFTVCTNGHLPGEPDCEQCDYCVAREIRSKSLQDLAKLPGELIAKVGSYIPTLDGRVCHEPKWNEILDPRCYINNKAQGYILPRRFRRRVYETIQWRTYRRRHYLKLKWKLRFIHNFPNVTDRLVHYQEFFVHLRGWFRGEEQVEIDAMIADGRQNYAFVFGIDPVSHARVLAQTVVNVVVLTMFMSALVRFMVYWASPPIYSFSSQEKEGNKKKKEKEIPVARSDIATLKEIDSDIIQKQYQLSSFTNSVDVRNLALCASKLPNDPEQWYSTMTHSIYAVTMAVGKTNRTNVAIYFQGHVCVTVKHMFHDVDFSDGKSVTLRFESVSANNFNRNHTETLFGSNFYFDNERDLVYIRTTMFKHPSRVHLLPDVAIRAQPYEGEATCFRVNVAENNRYVQRESVSVVQHHGILNYNISNSDKAMTTNFALKAKMPCDYGNCGSPLINDDLVKSYLLGIVIASSSTETYFQQLPREAFTKAVEILNEQCVVLGTSRSCEVPVFLPQYEPKLNSKSEFNFVDEVSTLDLMGFTANKRGPQKPSMVVNSLIYPVGEIKHCGPVLTHGYHEGFDGYFKPYWEMLKLSTNPPDIPLGPLTVCMYDLLDSIRSRVPQRLFKRSLMLLTIEQAVFGVDGVAYINKVKDLSSSGDPFYMPNGNFYNLETRWIDPRILSQVEQLRKKALSDMSTMVTFNVLLKDEVVKESKRFKPRVFTGGSLSFLVLAKQYFGSIARVVMIRRFDFETAQGLNTESPEWKDLYDHLTEFGLNTIVAGDFPKFDKKILKSSLRLAFHVLIALCRDSGNFNEEDFKVMDFIMDGICDAAFILYGTLFMLPCSEPSGHFLTTIINGFVTSMYIRLAYLLEFGEVRSFRKKVRLISVGDDHILSSAHFEFGFQTIKKWFDKFSAGYTGNDKNGPDPPNQDHIDNCNFLKRRFVYEQYPMSKGIMCAPIELDTISKLLNMFVRSKAMSMYEQTLECIENAMVFLAHHNPEVYYKWQEMVAERCLANSIRFEKRTYEEMWDSIATRRAYRQGVAPNSITSKALEVNIEAQAKALKSGIMASNSTKEDSTSKNTPISTGSTQQSTIFVDDASMVKKTFKKGSQAGLLCSVQPMAELAEFFKRPVQIQTVEWTGANSRFNQISQFNPWSLWMTHPTVVNKLQAYRNFRGNIHLRFMINSNKFLYGTVAVYYLPLAGFATYNQRTRYTSASQLPGLRMGSSHNFTQELELPFVWITDWYDLTTLASDFRTIGEVTFEVINSLKNVNSLTDANDKVEISVWAWVEDIELSGLTACDVFSQSSEMEDADGIISGPASAVAAVSGTVADMMGDSLIGRLARSTEIGSRAISRIATLAGFSRPPNIKGLARMKPDPYSNTAVCVGGDTPYKLTVDPQQELTVDGTYCGLSNDDDMTIACIAQTESYIGTVTFSTIHSTGTNISSYPVRPIMPTHISSVGSDNPMELPAITFASIPFTWWKGSIDYRFEVIATPFHKGRLRVVYEPTSTFAGAYDYNRNFQHVIDISETHDFSIRVEWSQMEHWKRVTASDAFTTHANTEVFPIDGNVFLPGVDNGRLTISVVNELSVPDRTLNFTINPVEINVYMKAGPDFELAVPDMSILKDFQAFPVNSASLEEEIFAKTLEDHAIPDKQVVQDDAECCESPSSGPTPDAHLVYMGEAIYSIRALCKRYTYFYSARSEATVSAAGNAVLSLRMWRYPLLPGDAPNGVFTRGGIPTNRVGWSFASWFGLGYALERGTIRTKLLTSRNINGLVGRVTRMTNPVSSGSTWYKVEYDGDLFVTEFGYALNDKMYGYQSDFGDGSVLYDMSAQPGIEFEIPFQSNVRFRPAVDRLQSLAGLTSLGTDIYDNAARMQFITYSNTPTGNDIMRNVFMLYSAAGEDFSLHWFIGPGTVWRY